MGRMRHTMDGEAYAAAMRSRLDLYDDEAVAKAIGVDKSTVGRWRRGETAPSKRSMREALAAFCGFSGVNEMVAYGRELIHPVTRPPNATGRMDLPADATSRIVDAISMLQMACTELRAEVYKMSARLSEIDRPSEDDAEVLGERRSGIERRRSGGGA